MAGALERTVFDSGAPIVGSYNAIVPEKLAGPGGGIEAPMFALDPVHPCARESGTRHVPSEPPYDIQTRSQSDFLDGPTPARAAYLSSLNSLCCDEPQLFATARIPLRVPEPHGNVRTLETFVTYLGESTFEIRLDHRVIGFIQRADHAFATRVGPRMKKTHGCPQCLLWDEAVREVVHAAGL